MSQCPSCGKTSEYRIKVCRCGHQAEKTVVNKCPEQGGPGSELLKIIPPQMKPTGCGCKSYAAKMDRWGVEGCREHIDEIVEHLVSQRPPLVPVRLAKWQALRWVKKAIAIADLKQQQQKQRHPRTGKQDSDPDSYAATDL